MNIIMAKKVLLGFSGGLDTSFCVKYLREDLGYEVHSILVNTGRFSSDEWLEIEQQAIALGVCSHHTEDAVKTYYQKVIQFLIYGNLIKNNTYPLSVSAERKSQAMAMAKYAQVIGVDTI